MRITIGTTQYRWNPGSRTINVWSDTPYTAEQAGWPLSRWLETDVMSFGYDKPDNSTTQTEAIAVILRSLEDVYPVDDDPAIDDEPPYGSFPEER